MIANGLAMASAGKRDHLRMTNLVPFRSWSNGDKIPAFAIAVVGARFFLIF
jgi:hypothetical protein